MEELGFHKENIKFFKHFGITDETVIPLKRVAIVLQSEYKSNPNAQQIYILSCNLAVRIFLNIDFIIPINTKLLSCVYDESTLVNEYVLRMAQDIFPCGNYKCKDKIDDASVYDGVLLIGFSEEACPNRISTISDGWNVYINKSNNCDNYNPIAACAASCMGVAELFKYVAKPKGCKICSELSFSLLNYSTEIPQENPPLHSQIDIGMVTLVGVGAIGSAVIYTLKCLNNVSGTLEIVDADKYSDTNLNRYIIASESTTGKYKVDIAEDLLRKHPYLKVMKHQQIYDIFKETHHHIDTLITAVDKRITRFNMQSDLPRLVIDAATTDSCVDLARMEFGSKGACLGCLYLPEPRDDQLLHYISLNTGLSFERVKYLYDRSEGVNAEDIEIISKHMGKNLRHCIGEPIESLYEHEYCGSSKISSNKDTEEAILAPVSFISAFAGVLITCELIKDRYYPEFKVNNHFFIDTLKLPNPKLHSYIFKSPNCPYCNDPVYLDVYKEKWQ